MDGAIWVCPSFNPASAYGGFPGNDGLCEASDGGGAQWIQTMGPPAFDVGQLDAASITAYFSWGWFVVVMGWLIGKGVSLLVQFIKQAF
jgi:hypothetical protein